MRDTEHTAPTSDDHMNEYLLSRWGLAALAGPLIIVHGLCVRVQTRSIMCYMMRVLFTITVLFLPVDIQHSRVRADSSILEIYKLSQKYARYCRYTINAYIIRVDNTMKVML